MSAAAKGSLAITWLGHGTFLLVSPGGKRILIDPWLAGNPACPDAFKKIDTLDLILVTHGHFDHVDDALSTARATGAPLVSNFELCSWLEGKGLKTATPMNFGGTLEIAGVAVTMVQAFHSSGYIEDGQLIYLGQPAGFVLRFENDLTIYFAGDTAIFGDMRLIGEMYSPSIAFLPIGDRFTMGPAAAARACQMIGARQVVPMHFGTFPMLTGTAAQFRELVEPLGIEILELQPGETAE